MKTVILCGKPPEKIKNDTAFIKILENSEDMGIIFMEDGVLNGIWLKSHGDDKVAKLIEEKNVKIYCNASDIGARGIGEDQLLKGITSITYEGIIDIVAQTEKVLSWL